MTTPRQVFIVTAATLSLFPVGKVSRAAPPPPAASTAQVEEQHKSWARRCEPESAFDEVKACRDRFKALLDAFEAANTGSREDSLLGAMLHCRVAEYEDRLSRLVIHDNEKLVTKSAALGSYRTCSAILRGQSMQVELAPRYANALKVADDRIRDLSHMDLKLTGVAPGARVFLDGIRQADAGLDGKVTWLDLAPGSHDVRIEHPEFETYREVFTLQGGEAQTRALVLVPRSTRSVAGATPGDKPTRWQATAAWTALGVAVVGVGVGIGCQVAADSNEAVIDAARDASGYVDPARLDPARARRLRSDADTLRTARTVGFVVAGSAAVAALTFFLWPDDAPRTALTPVSGGAIVQWQGAF